MLRTQILFIWYYSYPKQLKQVNNICDVLFLGAVTLRYARMVTNYIFPTYCLKYVETINSDGFVAVVLPIILTESN